MVRARSGSAAPYITANRVAKGANAKRCRGIVAELPFGSILFYMHSFISLSEIYGERNGSGTTSGPYCIAISTKSLIMIDSVLFTIEIVIIC